jgi:hypothetical protein
MEDGGSIAYPVLVMGAHRLPSGNASRLDVMWQSPHFANFYRGMAISGGSS